VSFGRIYIVEVMTQVLSKSKMKHISYWRQKYIRELSASFFENTEAHGVCENKNKKRKQRPVKKLIINKYCAEIILIITHRCYKELSNLIQN